MDTAHDVRTHADGDVAVHGLDAAAEIGIDHADRAIHRGHVAAHVAATVDEDAAIDGFHVAVDLRPLAETDAAVDRGDGTRGDVVPGFDAAVDGFHILGLDATF